MTLEATAHTWLPIKHSSPWWENAFYHYQVILCEPNKIERPEVAWGSMGTESAWQCLGN